MHCEPVLAVMSARFSCTANVLCMAALLALAARNEIFFPATIEEEVADVSTDSSYVVGKRR